MAAQYRFGCRSVLAVLFVLAMAFVPSLSTTAFAQYKRTDLVSNQAGKAPATDAHLVNGWGLTRFSFSPFWVSDNGTGFSTLYDGTGKPLSLVVTIPPAPGSTVSGTPTGDVANGTGEFVVSQNGNSGSAFFIFATLDGTIAGWNPRVNPTHAVLAVDRSGSGAVYTGLAIGSSKDGNFIYAADNGPNSRVDVFDGKFSLVKSFTDPNIPDGFAPYGIQNIQGRLWVTFGGNKAASGFVDIFDTEGNLIKHFAVNGPLHSPWGIALAPADFGPFSNALLVGNNIPGGRINAFNPDTGAFLGALRDVDGKPIVIDQVWALVFGGDHPANGAHNQLFFTAGPNNYANGTFGMITLDQ